MILSCPNCATQYKVNETVIGARGRTVRCKACQNTWFAETPVDLSYSEPRPQALDLEAEAAPKTKTKEELYEVKAKKLPGKYRAMLADKKRLHALAVEGMVWGGLAAVAVVTLALAYFLRIDIVKAFPRTAGAYAMVGMKVNPTYLEFENHTGEVNFKGGRFVVTVKAQIKNLSNKAVPVPPVRVKLFDSTQAQFDSVLMPAGGLMVEPHATRTLTFDVADPRNLVSTLDLAFDLEAMKGGKSGKSASHGDDHGQAKDHGKSDDHGEADAHGEAGTHGAAPAHGSEEAHAQPAESHATPAAADAHAAPADEHATEAVAPAPLSTQPAAALRSASKSAPEAGHAPAPSAHGGH